VTAEELMKEAAAETEGDAAPAKKEKKSRAKGKAAKAGGSEEASKGE
jgi:hypothetical protein